MEKIINNNFSEMFEEIIRTVPIVPSYFSVSMNVGGVSLPKNSDEVGEYISWCERNNVIPFSFVALESTNKAFYSNNAMSNYPKEFSSIDLADLIVLKIAKGGQPYGVEFHTPHRTETHEEGFVKLRDVILDVFLEQGYQVQGGNMTIGRETEWGFLVFTKDERYYYAKKGVHLSRLENLVETDRIKIQEWLSGLKERYDCH